VATLVYTGFVWKADWNRDNQYNHADSDITGYVLGAQYHMGMTQAYQEIASPARMEIRLDNSGGDWSVSRSGAKFASLFRKGVLVSLTAQYTQGGVPGGLQSVFIAKIREIRLAPGILGDKTATLVLEDFMLDLLDAEYHPPLLTNVTTDAAISRMFDDAICPFPYPHNYWMLGIAGASELGDTTIIFENAIEHFFDTGGTTLAYVGDNADAGQGVNAQSYIRDIVASEAGGRFYWDGPNGKFKFLNRYYGAGFTAPPDISGYEILQDPPPAFRYADDLANVIEISYELKKVGSSFEILYTAPNVPISLAPGATRTFVARYQDPDVPTARVGGISMLAPVAGADYTANDASDGSGTDYTNLIGVSAEFGGSSAKVSLSNNNAVTVYVTLFQLRGVALTSYAKETVTEMVGDSIFAYGEQRKSLMLPNVQSAEFVQDYARKLAVNFSKPFARVERLTYQITGFVFDDSAARIGVGGWCSYYDPYLEDGAQDYLCVGIDGMIDGTDWKETLILEPLNRAAFWALGNPTFGILGSTTVLAL
jgi:hypothetical protein